MTGQAVEADEATVASPGSAGYFLTASHITLPDHCLQFVQAEEDSISKVLLFYISTYEL